MITGDFNLELLCASKPEVLQYCDTLEQFNLTQIENKSTRTTLNRTSLIDHIILSAPTICKHTDVLPCPHIRDHDGPYAILNVRAPRFHTYVTKNILILNNIYLTSVNYLLV